MVNKSIRSALTFLYPQPCLLCGLPSKRSINLCAGCELDLPHNRHRCERCALPLHSASLDRVCHDCLVHPPPYQHCVIPWRYEAQIASMVRAFKQHGKLVYARLFGELLAEQLRLLYGASDLPEFILPVPLHWTRHLTRGFNQATETAYQLVTSQALRELPPSHRPRIASWLCSRTRHTTTQRRLDADARQSNLQQAFSAHPGCAGRRIAILDDVVTTGATVATIARELNRADTAEIHVWSIARTPLPSVRDSAPDNS